MTQQKNFEFCFSILVRPDLELTHLLPELFLRQFIIALRRLMKPVLAWFVDPTLGKCAGPTRILVKCA